MHQLLVVRRRFAYVVIQVQLQALYMKFTHLSMFPKSAVVGGRLGETPLPPRGKSIAPNRGLPHRNTNIIAKALAYGKGGILKLSDCRIGQGAEKSRQIEAPPRWRLSQSAGEIAAERRQIEAPPRWRLSQSVETRLPHTAKQADGTSASADSIIYFFAISTSLSNRFPCIRHASLHDLPMAAEAWSERSNAPPASDPFTTGPPPEHNSRAPKLHAAKANALSPKVPGSPRGRHRVPPEVGTGYLAR
jgi:hypothetical protein